MSRNAPPKEKAVHNRTTFLSLNKPITAPVSFSRTSLCQIRLLKLGQSENVFRQQERHKWTCGFRPLFRDAEKYPQRLNDLRLLLYLSTRRRKISILQCNELNRGHPTFFNQSQDELRTKESEFVHFGPITNERLAMKSCLFPSTKRRLIKFSLLGATNFENYKNGSNTNT